MMFSRVPTALILTFAVVVSLAADSALAKNAPEKPKTVDSGTFAIFINGQRVATETFQIQQYPDASVTTSEFKTESGEKSVQRAELQMAANGELRRYEWHEVSPGKAQLTLEPHDQFLLEHIAPNAPEKPLDLPLMLPHATMVLDDYFFSQRQVLAWRYLAGACPGAASPCRPEKAEFGIVFPRQRTPGVAILQFGGVEHINVKGTSVQTNRINLKIDGVDWVLWLDGNYKVLRMAIPSEKTEVVRE